MRGKKIVMRTINLDNLRFMSAEAAAQLAADCLEDLGTGDISTLGSGHGFRPSGPISDAERARRQEAVNYARASMGLSGFKLSEEAERHSQRFIDGEIDLAEFVKVRSDLQVCNADK